MTPGANYSFGRKRFMSNKIELKSEAMSSPEIKPTITKLLSEVEIVADQDIHVIRLIATYGEFIRCKGEKVLQWSMPDHFRTIISFTIDAYSRIWIAYLDSRTLHVVSLDGMMLFVVKVPELTSPRHIEIFGDKLVITQFGSSIVMIVQLSSVVPVDPTSGRISSEQQLDYRMTFNRTVVHPVSPEISDENDDWVPFIRVLNSNDYDNPATNIGFHTFSPGDILYLETSPKIEQSFFQRIFGPAGGSVKEATRAIIHEQSGDIFVAFDLDDSIIEVFNSRGIFVRRFNILGHRRNFGLCFDNMDRLWISDPFLNLIQIVDVHGNLLKQLRGLSSGDLALSPTGEIFMSVVMGGGVFKFNDKFEQQFTPIISISMGDFAFTPNGRIVTRSNSIFCCFE